MSRELDTSAAVIEALGGLAAVAVLTGSRYKSVSYWKTSGEFPPKTYIAITEALEERGYTAPSSLFGMVVPGEPS